MAEEQRKRLAVIDGKSVFYRGYYAMSNLSTKDGTPTGGVFGFATMALEVIRRLKPDYVAVAWDKPKTNIRSRLAIYPEYKAGRKPAPPDFYEQIPVLHELLDAFGWPLYELDDYEADDIMATLAHEASKKGIETLLITSDMDALQCVGPLTKMYRLKKGLSDIELYSPESFTAKYGIEPEQFLDLKALKGDSSDNIPGVPGIGEKTAIQLLQDYKTMDGVYENLWQVKDSVRKKLEAGKESAYMSKKLAALWLDAPVPLDLERMDGHMGANPVKIVELLEKLEFRSLARQLPEILHVDLQHHESGITNHGFTVGENRIIDDEVKLASVKIPNGAELVVYGRSAGVAGRDPKVLIVSADDKLTYVFDLAKVDAAKVFSKFKIQDSRFIGYDVKSSLKTLLGMGVEKLPEVAHDILVAAFTLNSLIRAQTLTDLAADVLGYDGSSFENMSDEELLGRGAEIVAVIRAIVAKQREEFQANSKFQILNSTVDMPVIPVLARMEYAGIQLDTLYLAQFSEQIEDSISDLEQQIYGHADAEFNIASPAQLATILFDKLGLPTAGVKKGKTGYSTAASELDKLRVAHPIIDLISQYREVTKLKNTYVDTLPKLVDGHGRVHTTFNLTIAQTGRLSSTDPNLQNIPVRTELGKHIRAAFVAGKGRKFVSADYSQFELRLAAAMSGDSEMVSMFNRGADIHLTTAAEVYGRSPEDVTKQMRSAAKTINFGVLYGMSPHGLAAATGMNFTQAKSFIDEYFKVRAPLLGYLNGLKEQAKKDGYVETLLGRRRPMPDIHSSNFIVRQAAARAAMNMPIQGTEADLMKLAMVAVERAFEARTVQGQTSQKVQPGRSDLAQFASKPQQLLQIHDSILVECAEQDAEKVADILKTTMEAIYPDLPVKLAVDTSIGDNWGEL
ncbi:DNA polymerase I [Candidatus Saccharibacteria bacterium]|nr:MAG: DNA polymerase I [Candidatus Saccharibacteria bacterium]